MANYLIFNQPGGGLGDTEKLVVNRDHVKYVSYIATNKLGLKLNSGSLITIQLQNAAGGITQQAPALIDNINDALKANPSGKNLEVKLPLDFNGQQTAISSGSSIVQPSATSLFDLDEASKNSNSSFQIGSTSTDFIPDGNNRFANLFIQNNSYGSGIEDYTIESTVAVGFGAGGTGTQFQSDIYGTMNVFMGYQCGAQFGDSPNGGFLTSYSNNTAIGAGAGYGLKEGKSNTFLGAFTGFTYNQGSTSVDGNVTMIGYYADASSPTATNEITLGNSSIATLRCAVTSITSLSDERDKKDITDLTYGLDFIESLQPKQFTWDNRPEMTVEVDKDGNYVEKEIESANKGKKDFGFIAQDVQALDDDVLRLVYDENPDKLEMSYGKLVPILVKAVKELSDKVKALEAK